MTFESVSRAHGRDNPNNYKSNTEQRTRVKNNECGAIIDAPRPSYRRARILTLEGSLTQY